MIEEQAPEQEQASQKQEPAPQEPAAEIAKESRSAEPTKEQAIDQVPDTDNKEISTAGASESPAKIKKQAAETKLQTHYEKGLQEAQELKEKYPDLEVKNPEEFKEQAIQAELEAGATQEEAEEKYEKTKNGLMALGAEFVTWFTEVGIGESDLTELIDAFFSNYYSGSSSASSMGRGKETAPGQKVSKEQFIKELGYTASFAEALRQSYDKGNNRLKDLVGFRLNRDNLNQAADGNKEAMQNLIIELDDLFSHDEKHWAGFKKVFAQNLYPNKGNIELDDSIKNFIADMVKRDKLDRYVGAEEEDATDKDEA